MPQLPAACAIVDGVERVHIVVLSGHEDDVMCSAGNRQVRHIQRLGVDLARNSIGKQLAESGAIYIGRREDRFVRVEALAREIVVPRCYVYGEHAARLELFETKLRLFAGTAPAAETFRICGVRGASHDCLKYPFLSRPRYAPTNDSPVRVTIKIASESGSGTAPASIEAPAPGTG